MAKGNPTARGRRPSPSAAATGSALALTPKEVLGMLRRHLWLILFMTVLGGALGTAGWYLMRRFKPLYQAETILKVLPPVESDPMDIVATQVQQNIQYGHRVSLANLMKRQSSLQELLRSDKVRQTKWFTETVRGDARDAVAYLDRNLTAFPHREAEHIIVSMTCGSPSEAALIINEMARLFVSQHGQTQRADVNSKLVELTSRQSEVERQIADSERAMQRLRQESKLADLERPEGRYFQHTVTLQLNDLELQENELSLAIKQLRADIENLKILAEGPITDQVEHAIEGDPVMIALTQQLALLEGQLSGRLTKFGASHRVVRQTQESIDEIERARQQRRMAIAEQTRRANLYNARDSLRVLEERRVALQQLRDEALGKQKDLDEARSRYEQYTKSRDERTEMLNQIKVQIEKLRIMLDDPRTPKVQILGQAPDPLKMVISRHIALWGPGGTMMGLMCGLALAFLAETLNDLVRTPSDVRRFLRVPLLGVIPHAHEDRAVDDIDPCHVVAEAPYSLLGESYRRCRTNLDLSGETACKTLLVGSGSAGDGKTALACNLAAAFAAKHEKVLLIDANLRQPHLHVAFPLSGSEKQGPSSREGLTSLLTGQCDIEEAICSSNIHGLDLIYAGPPTASPAELLASYRMKEVLEAVARDYDRVVVDSPPVLLVSDVKVLAKLVDATLLVFNAASTKRGAAQRTLFELRDVEARVIGGVLFGAEAIKGGYFRQQYKAYRRYLKPQLAASSA